MSIDSLPPLRDVIDRHELMAKKSLGQNFLLDLNLTAKIARQAGDLQGQTVIEVGPGPGGLTRALLAQGAQVIAIERDERCLAALQEISDHYPGRLQVISGDALETDFKALAGNGTVKIVANLPYNVGTQLLIGWLLSEAMSGASVSRMKVSRRTASTSRRITPVKSSCLVLKWT